jgi:hypothetical protein
MNLENPVNYGDESTSTATKEAIAKLMPADQVALAQYLLDCIKAGESLLHDKTQNVADWMNFVLQKQK